MSSLHAHTHFSLILPDFDFAQAGAECYNYQYKSRHDSNEVSLALENFDRHITQGTAIEGGITRDDVANGNYILPLDELADIIGSRNEVLGQLDKAFDGYLIAGGSLFDEYSPEEAITDYDGDGLDFEKSKRIMRTACKSLKDNGITAPRRINWDEVTTIFTEEFIQHWAKGVRFAYDDSTAPATFNLGINEVATILDWDANSGRWD